MSCTLPTTPLQRRPWHPAPQTGVPRFGQRLKLPTLQEFKVDDITLGYIANTSKPLPMSNTLLGKQPLRPGIEIVTWPAYAQAPSNTPLQTYGMYRCTALSIQGPQKKHYLLHLCPETPIDMIQEHLEQDLSWPIHHPQNMLSLVPGIAARTGPESLYPLLKALHRIQPSLAKRVQFRHFPPEAVRYGPNYGIQNPRSLVSYLGQLFCHGVSEPFWTFKPNGIPMRPDQQVWNT